MHQPVYRPDDSTWSRGAHETAYETVVPDHSENDEEEIFRKADRIGEYQHCPRRGLGQGKPPSKPACRRSLPTPRCDLGRN